MTITLIEAGKRWELPSSGSTLLETLKEAGVPLSAPCDGRGVCKQCKVLVKEDENIAFCLACQTPPRDGMEVTILPRQSLSIATSGFKKQWALSPHAGDGSVDLQQPPLGFAIDIGTTTLVCRLHRLDDGEVLDAAAQMNPQVIYGADVISRISAANDGHRAALTSLIREALLSMMLASLSDAEYSIQAVTDIVVVGNTVMLTLLAGLDPRPLGEAPFQPEELFGDTITIDEWAQASLNKGRVFCAACESAYVGSDVVAGLLALDTQDANGFGLYLDLGTNGELALIGNEDIFCCSTAAGPVFEGASIACGMPAFDGAIAAVDFCAGKLFLSVIGDREPLGLCGTALIDCIAGLLNYGLMDQSGRLLDLDEIDRSRSQGYEWLLGEFDGQRAFFITDTIALTQADVRQFQLAKGAIAAGTKTLLEQRGIIETELDFVKIAGGFARHLDLSNAATAGLIPAACVSMAQSVGNAAIEGASAILISEEARQALERLDASCRVVELSTNPLFNSYYPDALGFTAEP